MTGSIGQPNPHPHPPFRVQRQQSMPNYPQQYHMNNQLMNGQFPAQGPINEGQKAQINEKFVNGFLPTDILKNGEDARRINEKSHEQTFSTGVEGQQPIKATESMLRYDQSQVQISTWSFSDKFMINIRT